MTVPHDAECWDCGSVFPRWKLTLFAVAQCPRCGSAKPPLLGNWDGEVMIVRAPKTTEPESDVPF